MQHSVAEITAKKLQFPGKNAGKNTGKTSIATQCICAGKRTAKGKGRVNSEFLWFSNASFHGLGRKMCIGKVVPRTVQKRPYAVLGKGDA